MDMADGNFTANHRILGKKNGSQHDDRNDKIVLPPRSACPTWVHFYLTSRIPITITLRTQLISPKSGLSNRSNPIARVLVYKGFGPQLTDDHSVEHIPGQQNVADFFTKALPKSKYDQFHRYLVVNRDCMEDKRPKKKIKTITMDKTL